MSEKLSSEIHRRAIEISKIEIDAISLTYYYLNGRFQKNDHQERIKIS